VGEETDERHIVQRFNAFQAAGDDERVVTLRVQINDDERAPRGRLDQRLKGSGKFQFDAQMLRRRANLRREEKIVNGNDHKSLR